MDELRKEKNRLALEKIELLDKISSYESREDLSRDDKNDALEELNERLEVLEEELIKTRQAYNVEASKANHEEKSLEYEQMRNRRESQAKYEEGQAKYEQMRNDKKAKEDLFLSFMSENESARNEFMRGASIEDIKAKHAGEIEAFEKKKNDSVDVDVSVDANNNPDIEDVPVQSDSVQNGDDPYSYIRAKYGLPADAPKEEMDAALSGLVNNNESNPEVSAGERPVYADPTNAIVGQLPESANDQSMDLNDIISAPEIAGQEMIEPTVESNQKDNKTLFERAKEGFNGILSTEGAERKVVKKIANTAAIVAAATASVKIALAVLNPFLTVAGIAGAAWLGGEFMKGRKL